MRGYHPAKVIDNNDPKKQGRVKIKIEHIHYGFSNEMLPWARQSSLSTGGSNTYGESSIPEANSYLWVWFEEVDVFYKQPYYVADLQFAGKHPHGLFESNVKTGLGSASVYPNTKYTYYKNGICIGVDSSSGNAEVFVYHPAGFKILINKNGYMNYTDPKNTIVSSSTGILINSNLEILV